MATDHTAYLPGNFSALRATGIDLLHENGAFLLSLTELRLVTHNDGTSKPTNVEIGRFYLSPVAALLIAQQTIRALREFLSASQIPEAVRKVFGTEQVEDTINNLEREMNRRD
jgi:hypothetical protein